MKTILKGQFSERIEQFVAQKRSLGFSYDQSLEILSHFNNFCNEYFPNETVLSMEVAYKWANRKENETATAFRARLTPVREFARYLNSIGEQAFVLTNNYAKKPYRPNPYIYSQEEIRTLWATADNATPEKQAPFRHLVIPAMLRVLYCCGLRPAEVRTLKAIDVDLLSGKIFIEASKKHTDRIVMMADDLAIYCREYDKQLRSFLPNREYFFPKTNGKSYTKSWFAKTFNQLKARANITGTRIQSARLYDFRHSFATHRLYQWMKEGRDLTAIFPYLSAYMGHAHLKDTYYYIHLVPEQFQIMSGFNFSKYENLLPEVEDDE